MSVRKRNKPELPSATREFYFSPRDEIVDVFLHGQKIGTCQRRGRFFQFLSPHALRGRRVTLPFSTTSQFSKLEIMIELKR
jgi:hypothetical protein